MVILADQLINLSESGMCCLKNITNSTWNFPPPPKQKSTPISSVTSLCPQQKKEHCGFFFPPSQTKHQPPWRLLSIQASATRSGSFRTKAVVFGVGDPSFKESDFLKKKCSFWCQNLGWTWLMFPCLVNETQRNWGIVWNCRIHLCSWQIVENKPALNRLVLGIILYKDQCCRSPMVSKNRTIQQIQR